MSKLSNILLETDRLIIREMTEEDIAIRNELMEMNDGFIYEKEFTKQDIERNKYVMFVLKENNEVIGFSGFKTVRWGFKKPTLVFAPTLIHKDYRRQGLHIEARNAMLDYLRGEGIPTIHTMIDEDNIANINAMKKMGWKFVKKYRGVVIYKYSL